MAWPKSDNRCSQKIAKTRLKKSKSQSYSNYGESQDNLKLKKALSLVQRGRSMREAAKISKVLKSTIMNNWRRYLESNKDIDSFLETRSGRIVVMTDTEEKSVEQYCLWQYERGMNLENHAVKAIIRDIHAKVVKQGEKRQPINMTDGPSKKSMRAFYSRHPSLKRKSAKYVDHGHINMANKDTTTDYFKLLLETLVKCDIIKLDSNGNVIQESMKQERVYLADETGWGVQSKRNKSLDAIEQSMFTWEKQIRLSW